MCRHGAEIIFLDSTSAKSSGNVISAEEKFRLLTEPIDTSGPAGHMMMHMLGSFTEFEREMIRERTRGGLGEARTQGRVPRAPVELTRISHIGLRSVTARR